MKIVDIGILVILLIGAISGFKRGLIKTLIDFVGYVLIAILAYYIKTPISDFLIDKMPFFDFPGTFSGLTSLNIILYSALSFLVVFILLSCVWGIILSLTKFINKLVDKTIVLGAISKILGIFGGLLNALVFVFVALFVLCQISATNNYVMESRTAQIILARTPILSNVVGKTYNTMAEIYDLQDKYKNVEDKTNYNIEATGIMIKYDLVSKETVEKLISDKKLIMPGVVFY